MTGPSSTPRPEHTPRPGVTWTTELVRTETVIADDAPNPRPNRETRRALKHATRKKAAEQAPRYPCPSGEHHAHPGLDCPEYEEWRRKINDAIKEPNG